MAKKTDVVDFITIICRDKKKLNKLKKVDSAGDLEALFQQEKIEKIPDQQELERLAYAISQFKGYLTDMDRDDLIKY